MRKLCFKRIIAAAMICSLVISYADITPAFAANIDETEEISDSVDDTAEDINKGSEVSENEIIETQSDDKEAGYQEISDNSASDGSQSGVLSIAEIKELPAAERVISLENKVSEEDAVSELPETWSVILQDGTERDVRVAWKCKGDFNDDSYTSFVFQGVIDDESVEPVGDENITQKLSMEIYFENAVKYGDDNMIVSLLSPDTIIPEIDKEQGTGEYTEDFTADYGSEVNAVIGSLVDYSSSKVKLSNSAYNVFKGISPASDNYLYSKLSAGEKRFYNNIDIQVAQYLYYGAKCTSGVGGQPYTAFIPSAGLSTEEMEKVFYVYYYNNPQAFFLTNAISISGSMDQGYSMSIAFLPDAATPSTLKSKAEEIAKNIKSLSATVNKQSKEYDKAKKAQSLLCKRVTIDQDYITTTQWKRWTEGSQKYDQSVMSVFSGKRKASLSGGYSKSFMALARLAGIETFDITSIGGREWNKARLYGEWFNVDTMADDTDDMSGSGCIYDSFMKSDTTVNKDGTHTWAEIWKKLAPKSSRNYTAKTKRYSIKYHLNGGKNNKYNPSAYTVKAGTIKLWSPTRTGYK
ncbi:MAG: hypothetical protein IJV16_01335, partial [Lachnospiraceae bacterium]|nr:hypothetical protein [Lachnospiraceae bacterium]